MFQSFAFMSRRDFIAAAAMAAAGIVCSSPRGVFAAEPEKRSVTIAVGGKNLYYYLPMALADWMGFYKDEGLDVKVVDFQGGSKSLQAVVGGSADVVAGAFEHTLSMQTKRQSMQAFVLQDRAPQCVFAINRRTMKGVKDPAALKGRRIGVTAPGAHSHVMANFVMARAGVKSNEYSAIGIGSALWQPSALGRWMLSSGSTQSSRSSKKPMPLTLWSTPAAWKKATHSITARWSRAASTRLRPSLTAIRKRFSA